MQLWDFCCGILLSVNKDTLVRPHAGKITDWWKDVEDDVVFYLFLQKQKIALKPYTLWVLSTRRKKQTHVMMLSPLP